MHIRAHVSPSVFLRILRTRPQSARCVDPSRLQRSIASTPQPQATHRDSLPSSLLSQSLDQKQRAARSNDSVGPFALGMVQPSMGDDAKVKKWSQLSTSGKVMRTTARTTNFTVILLGAGLTAVLVYALTSELFARNSPTVLYGEACERIKASPKVGRYLQSPLSFHNTPPTNTRPRHRNRQVSSQLAVDSAHREHLLLNFYVRGSHHGPATSSPVEESYLAWTQSKLAELSDVTWNEAVDWMKVKYRNAQERSKRAFLYLTGQPLPSSVENTVGSASGVRKRTETQIGRESKEEEGLWRFAGLFTGLRGRAAAAAAHGESGADREVWEEGEVHADLVKDDNGNFVWRYILIDLPSSRSRYPTRVFVERSPDVREREAVMQWG